MSTNGNDQKNYNHSVHEEAAVQKHLPCLCILYIHCFTVNQQNARLNIQKVCVWGGVTPETPTSAERYSKADQIDTALINSNLKEASHSYLLTHTHKLTVLQFSRYTKQFLN